MQEPIHDVGDGVDPGTRLPTAATAAAEERNRRATVLVCTGPEVDVIARKGWQLGLHAIGDAAIVQTVNAYLNALRKVPGVAKDHRWFLDPFTVMPPAATLQTMARDRIFIAQQPKFLYNLEVRYVATLDDWRLRHNNSLGTLLHRYNLFVAFGSDNLPIGPMVGLC